MVETSENCFTELVPVVPPTSPWSNQAFLRRGPRQGSDGTHLLRVQLLWHRALQNEGLARNVETSKPQTSQACYIWMM